MDVKTHIHDPASKGKGMHILHRAMHHSDYGTIHFGMNDDGYMCWLGFGDNISLMRQRYSSAVFTQSNDNPDFTKISLFGTKFQVNVWNALLTIPFGQTQTYGHIAAMLGNPKASRAIGTAVGRNPVSIVIPCHRVLPAAGGVGNYLWGANVKRRLLSLEKAL